MLFFSQWVTALGTKKVILLPKSWLSSETIATKPLRKTQGLRVQCGTLRCASWCPNPSSEGDCPGLRSAGRVLMVTPSNGQGKAYKVLSDVRVFPQFWSRATVQLHLFKMTVWQLCGCTCSKTKYFVFPRVQSPHTQQGVCSHLRISLQGPGP